MLARYCGPGLLGLGITALIAGFMAGMAGNVSAFATVWTYDLYRPFLRKNAPDKHYVSMGRWCTLIGLVVSIGTAYLVMGFASIMDYVQALFGFFIAPLFGTVSAGNDVETRHPLGRIPRIAGGDDVVGGNVHFDEAKPVLGGRVCAESARAGAREGYVPVDVVVRDVRGGHGAGDDGHEAATGRRVEGTRV